MLTRRSFSMGLGLAPLVGKAAVAQVCTSTCYIGQVANGCFAPDVGSIGYSAATSLMTRSPHYMKGTPPWIQLILPNWYFDFITYTYPTGTLRTRGPVPSADARQWAASIEYNGSIVQATFGGSHAVYAAPGANVTTDPIDISGLQIPDGGLFFVRLYQASAGDQGVTPGVVFTTAGNLANPVNMSLLGEAVTYSGATDQTAGGTVANQFNGLYVRPLAILGPTTLPSVALIGDSRMAGWQDSFDSTGDLGEIGRAIGLVSGHLNYGYMNLAGGYFRAYDLIGGPTLNPSQATGLQQLNNAAFAQEVLLRPASYCSHLVCNLGGADIRSGYSVADVLALREQIWALWPKGASRIATTTIAPVSTSPDNEWLFTAQQAQSGNFDQASDTFYQPALALNGQIRSGADGVKVFDTAAQVEVGGAADTHWFWNSDGVTPNLLTNEGLHENTHGYQVASGAVDSTWFTSSL